MTSRFGMGDLVREMIAIAQLHRVLLAALAVGLVVVYTLLDLTLDGASNAGGMVAGLVVEYAVLQRMLDRSGEPWRLGSMLGSQLLSGLGMLVGLVFLILPGLFLAARWALAPAFVIVDQRRAGESLSASWDATAECWKPLAGVYVILFVAFVGALLGAEAALQSGFVTLPAWGQSAIPNVIAVLYSIACWLVVAAAFRLWQSVIGGIEDVFA